MKLSTPTTKLTWTARSIFLFATISFAPLHPPISSLQDSAWAAEVLMAAPDVGARINSVSARAVCRWVEAGKIHFAETAEGPILVCLNSLASLES